MKKVYEIVERYVRNECGDKAPNTRNQMVTMISTALSELERDHGVKVNGMSVEGLNGLVLSDWKGQMTNKRKPATVNCYIAMMRPFLRWLHATGIVERDWCGSLKTMKLPSVESLPEAERPKEKYLTHKEAHDLLDSGAGYNSKRDRAIIALILYTGLRTEELCSLNVGAFYGPHAVYGEIEVKRKGGNYKKIPIPDAYYPYITAYLNERRDKDNEDAPLFTTTRGTRCNRVQIWYALSRKQKAEGVATGGHALRHTFVSEVEKLGGAGIARDLANHSSLAITNRYVHTTETQRHDAVAGLKW